MKGEAFDRRFGEGESRKKGKGRRNTLKLEGSVLEAKNWTRVLENWLTDSSTGHLSKKN